MLGKHLVKSFMKDFKIPGPVQRNDFLEYYINTYDSVLDCKKYYDLFLNTIDKFENEDHFLGHRYKILENVVADITNNETYKAFIEDKNLLNFQFFTNNIKGKNFYKTENAGKFYLSIDLRSGNFMALKHYDKDIVKNCETWEEYVKNFTEYEYFGLGKTFRQKVLGHLNVKRIMNYERILLEEDIVKPIIDVNILSVDMIVSHNFDEVVFEIDKNFDEKIIEIPEKFKNDVHVEKFELEQIKPYSMFVKKMENKIKFKGVNNNLFPQVFKHYMNLPLDDKDMYFVSDTGHLCKYVEKLEF